MRLRDGLVRLSASDLANHLGCQYLTWLNLLVATGELEAPKRTDPRLDALIQRGFQHENAYLAHLEAQGRKVTRLPKADNVNTGVEQTLSAMKASADVIVQPALTSGGWIGYADVLLRVETPSNLGEWSYEVLDTKLARETRGGTILQLALYSDIVGELQERFPAEMHVFHRGTISSRRVTGSSTTPPTIGTFASASRRLLLRSAKSRAIRNPCPNATSAAGGVIAVIAAAPTITSAS